MPASSFQAALDRRRQRPTPALPPLVVAPLVGILVGLTGFALATARPTWRSGRCYRDGWGGSHCDPRLGRLVPPAFAGGGPASRWPILELGTRGAALAGFVVAGGTLPDAALLRGSREVVVVADRDVVEATLAGWLTALRLRGVQRVKLTVANPKTRSLRFIDAELLEGRPAACAGDAPWSDVLERSARLLESDYRVALRVGPGCLAFQPWWEAS